MIKQKNSDVDSYFLSFGQLQCSRQYYMPVERPENQRFEPLIAHHFFPRVHSHTFRQLPHGIRHFRFAFAAKTG